MSTLQLLSRILFTAAIVCFLLCMKFAISTRLAKTSRGKKAAAVHASSNIQGGLQARSFPPAGAAPPEADDGEQPTTLLTAERTEPETMPLSAHRNVVDEGEAPTDILREKPSSDRKFEIEEKIIVTHEEGLS